MSLRSHPPLKDFTVWWLCALPIEFDAAQAVLDEIYDAKDIPQFILGRSGRHSIVVGCLPAGQIGLSPATAVATELHNIFPSLKHGFMVGIAGGVPSTNTDIRLGDVIISQPQGCNGGVVQYDFGKILADGKLFRTGSLNSPPRDLLVAVSRMKSNKADCQRRINATLTDLAKRRQTFNRPSMDTDRLFEHSYNHVQGELCDHCLKERLIKRTKRMGKVIAIHYGTVASGNQLIKDGLTRDYLSAELGGVLCFEMEAAGLMNSFPCLIVRGVCDYADSHKNKAWQPFAAAAAASCAKEVLSFTITPQMQIDYHKSLLFDQINSRHGTVRAAHSETCSWFLERPEYRAWLAEENLPSHHGLLWVKGKPGAGKSTLMKFVSTMTKNNMENEQDGAIILAFYFNARGVQLEKSCDGMYRSLLFQLLENFPDLQHVFGWRPPAMPEDRSSIIWDLETLQLLFGHAVEQIRSRSVICFIDALDECDEDQVREMVLFFEHLGNLTVSSGLAFRCCFSSRHYPHIFIKKGIEIILEDQNEHRQDIMNYLDSELRKGRSKVLDTIKTDILEKASGVFLWVVLVVPMLNKAYDHGRVHALTQLVNELPKGLDELFGRIISRDEFSVDEMILCLQWVLFARRPLSPEELYFAIRVGIDPQSSRDWDRELLDFEDIVRYVLSVSKGLTELTKTKGGVKTVQFIHASVQDYLFERSWLERYGPDLLGNFPGLSHDRLKNLCQEYTTCLLKPPRTNLRFDRLRARELMFIRNRIALTQFPFLTYAVRNLLYHANLAAEFGLPQGHFIDGLLKVHWVSVKDVFHLNEDPQQSPEVSLLFNLAKENLANLVPAGAKWVPRIDTPGFRRNSPLIAALAHADNKTARALLAQDMEFSTDGSGPQCCPFPLSKDEFNEAVNTLSSMPIIKGYHPLLWAAGNNKIDVVKVLLNTTKIDENCRYLNPNPREVSEILIYRDGQTPLSIAALCGHEAVVKLLLYTGKADINAKDNIYGQTALSIAAERGHERMVKQLLDSGKVDVDSKDIRYFDQTPLSIAAQYGHEMVVKYLLGTGEADVNSRDHQGRTPLLHAAANGNVAVVKLLLDTGMADVDLRDRVYDRTPLEWTEGHIHIDVAKLLYDHIKRMNMKTARSDDELDQDNEETTRKRRRLHTSAPERREYCL